MTYVIAQPCVDLKDKACIEECPVDCIYEGRRSLYIHPDECVDCGACEPVCPVEAIYYEDDVPEEWADYYNANVEFFNDLGSPGGAAKLGMIDKDHPLIVALPPQDTTSEPGVIDRSLPDFLGLARALQGASERASGRDRRPVGRHSGRPHAPFVRTALAEAADAPGYPVTVGTTEVREAICEWFGRRRGVPGLAPSQAIPTIGSKELVAWLPTLLGLGPGDIVGIPEVAYPTYDVGARLAGASSVVAQSLTRLGPLTRATTPKLLWLNSPSNPSGQVLGVEHLAKVVAWAREHGVVVASDECYAELDWRPGQLGRATPSVLHPDVCGGDHSGLLAVYSLEAVQSGRLPRGLRRRRCGAHRADPRGPQARRDDDARARPACDGGSARRRRPRGGAARLYGLRPRCSSRRFSERACGSTTPRLASTSGPPARRTAGQRFPSSQIEASSSLRAASTVLPGTGTSASP